jgi:hypothetical protein
MRVAQSAVLMLALTGCVSNKPAVAVRAPRQAPAVSAEPSPPKGFAWARIDGQLLSGSPERTAQARSDIAGCRDPALRSGGGSGRRVYAGAGVLHSRALS